MFCLSIQEINGCLAIVNNAAMNLQMSESLLSVLLNIY